MERDLVHKAIDNPEVITKSGSDTWQQLVARYPYFTAAQKILLKSWQTEGDYRFSDQLYQTAAHSIDRSALYRFVKETETETESISETAKETKAVIPAITEKEAVIVAKVEVEAEKPVAVPEQGTIDLVSRIMDEESQTTTPGLPIQPEVVKPAEMAISNPISEIETTATVQNPTPPEEEIHDQEKEIVRASAIDPFERTLLVEAVRSSIEAEVSEKDETSSDHAEGGIEAEEDDNSYAAYILRRSRQLHFGELSGHKPAEEEAPEASKDWIRNEFSAETEEIQDENPENDVPPVLQTGLSHGSKKINVQDTRTHQKDLIDRFIRLEPHIARGKSTEYTPGNIARESLEEDFSFITETMAKLFAAQGKTDKARKAYRKLMELYPEKSVYFAAQLKNLDRTKK